MPARWRTLDSSEREMSASTEGDARHRAVFTGSPVGIGLSDEHGHLIAANPALCALFGRSEADLLGGSTVRFTHPDDLHTNRSAQAMLQAAAEEDDGVVRLEKRYLRPDGEVRWAWLTVSMTTGPSGQAWTVTHLQDVTERKVAEQALRDSEASLAAMAQVVRRLQTGGDPRQTIVQATLEIAGANTAALYEPVPGALTITASAGLDLVGARVQLEETSAPVQAYRTGTRVFLLDPVGDPLANARLATMSEARTVLCQPVCSRGGVLAVLTVGWPHRIVDLEDRAARTIALLADEAAVALEHDRLLRELASSALTDSLTGLANRRGWDLELERLVAMARRSRNPLTVAIVDLDRFKAYNDSRGHLAGDRLLRRFADRARATLRDVDLVARWGGEELTIALPNCSTADAAVLLPRLLAAVPDGQTCSIGCATWDGDETVEQLLTRADAALYAAKGTGRNRVCAA